ncbi:MAG TPA: sugar ABC transporter substrate-binding protein, partial [Lachnospiraceae bacterium]|nr:sugar ABC transporter substrate-binding protein [Lachnospiraceae bacterium]
MKKKFLSILLSIAMVSVMLAGCGSTAETEESTDTAVTEEDTTAAAESSDDTTAADTAAESRTI